MCLTYATCFAYITNEVTGKPRFQDSCTTLTRCFSTYSYDYSNVLKFFSLPVYYLIIKSDLVRINFCFFFTFDLVCSVPNVKNAVVESTRPNKITVNETITITCNSNYTLRGSKNKSVTMYCQQFGSYSTAIIGVTEPLPVCISCKSTMI